MQKLPTIKEIEKMDLSESDKIDALTFLLNQNPPASWIKDHPTAKNCKYLPIDKVEYLLTKIFGGYRVVIKKIKCIANSATVVVELTVKNPITGEFLVMDGVGAAPIHTKSGAGAMDWNAVNTDSVMKAVPSAESYAIKDASEKFGRIFGKDLNRKDLMTYDNFLPKSFENAKLTEQ